MITHDYKLIFIHVPKCAGRSICDIFNQRFDHFTLMYYEKDYQHYYPEYNAFAIVRNPYDRYVSMYHYIKNHRRHKTEPIGSCNSFREWMLENVNNFAGTFRYNSAQAEWGTDYMIGSPFWFSPQTRFIQDSHGSLDKVKIFKYEDGLDIVKEWLQKLGVPVTEIQHLNRSEHDNYLSYYDNKLLQEISHFNPLREDCNRLGYNLILNV